MEPTYSKRDWLTREEKARAYDLLVNKRMTRQEAAEALGWPYRRVKTLVWRNDWPVASESRGRAEPKKPKPSAPRAAVPMVGAAQRSCDRAEATEREIWLMGDDRYVAALAREMLARGWVVGEAA
jgi:hypothetical protein